MKNLKKRVRVSGGEGGDRRKKRETDLSRDKELDEGHLFRTCESAKGVSGGVRKGRGGYGRKREGYWVAMVGGCRES